jgi:hypothetical protein
MAATGCRANTTSMCTTGTVCERHAPAGCLDPNWAEWPMPNATGQVNAASYHDNGDGTVTDNVTGLMWQQLPSSVGVTWPAAQTLCPQLTLGGHSDWRVPTLIELVSLVDFTVGNFLPTINQTFFSAVPAGFYWTSTVVANQNNFAWEINFNNGVTNADSTAGGNNMVICVR